jgi:FHA domain-containing protein/trypsin
MVFSGPHVRIGRSRDNSLILTESDAPASSARHAEAVVEGGAWWIIDAGSTNGTFVNGVRVDRRRLAIGDRLAFGDDQFVVAAGGGNRWLAVAASIAVLALIAVATFATRRAAPISREHIATAAAQSVYAIVLESSGSRSIVGTAFAVGDSVLATNAHVAAALRDAAARSVTETGMNAGTNAALAIRSDTYEVCRITDVTLHPEWKPGSLHADAALLRVRAPAPLLPVSLAADADFRRLRRGASLVSFGFPAVSTDVQHPRGRLAVDVVGDVRGEYVEAGAIVAAGDFARAANGALAPTGSQANWAISIERVRELLRR